MLKKNEQEINHKITSATDTEITSVFKALSDVNRYRIFRLLAEQPKLAVSDVAKSLNISLPLASQHIKVLTHAHLLQKERDGKKVFTKLKRDNPFVLAINKTIRQILK